MEIKDYSPNQYFTKYSKVDSCYGPSVISVTVTKGGHPRGSGLYRTSKTMG